MEGSGASPNAVSSDSASIRCGSVSGVTNSQNPVGVASKTGDSVGGLGLYAAEPMVGQCGT